MQNDGYLKIVQYFITISVDQQYFQLVNSPIYQLFLNENSFSRWIIEKSDGLTMLGLQKLSKSVRNYAYLILTSQTSTTGPIVGHEA